MGYKLYKLQFLGGVHFGNSCLENSEYTFYADTLFSALCQEAMKTGDKALEKIYAAVKNGELIISDAFPYMGKVYYLPKPMKRVDVDENNGNSIIKKAFKKLKYIPVEKLDEYFAGKFDVLNAADFDELGDFYMKVSASVRGEEETKPYRVQTFYFKEGNGLYIIVKYASEEILHLFEDLLLNLSFSGIGGKRSSGMGKFELHTGNIPMCLEKRLEKTGRNYMTLSISLPKRDELSQVMEGAEYLLCKRSGFVASEQYCEKQMRKRDMYLFQSGSCFCQRFEGDIYDVSSNGGHHSVYRYAKPIFMEVGI